MAGEKASVVTAEHLVEQGWVMSTAYGQWEETEMLAAIEAMKERATAQGINLEITYAPHFACGEPGCRAILFRQIEK